MILKALYNYYFRCREIYGDQIPPLGFERRTMEYVILISKEGVFKKVITDQDSFVPRAAPNKTSGVEPNILWDSAKYMLNDDDSGEIPNKYNDHCKSIVDIVCELSSNYPDNDGFRALNLFYSKKEYKNKKLLNDPLYPRIIQSKAISFKVLGEIGLVCSYSEELQSYILKRNDNNPKERCLITGNKASIVMTTGGFSLGMANNGKVVSFQKDSGYDSQGKQQCANAPMSTEAEFAYTQALKMLSESERNSVIQFRKEKDKTILDRVLLFWSSANNIEEINKIETPLFGLSHPQDNPDDVAQIKKFFENIRKKGYANSDNDNKYYFLELVPTTKGRIAISFWFDCSISEFAKIASKHYEDFELVTDRNLRYDAIGILNAVSEIKEENGRISYDRPHNLADSVFRSIFTGNPYPESLYVAALTRIQAEQVYPELRTKEYYALLDRDSERTAIIKAYLNRYSEINNIDKLDTMLDLNYDNQGYLCGRLFAILEYTQQKANYETTKIWKSDLRSKYMNAAMSSPATVFPAILSNSEYYLDKLNKTGWLEELKQEIVCKIIGNESFPSSLSLHDQGRYWVGYYHQRYELNKSKSEKESVNI